MLDGAPSQSLVKMNLQLFAEGDPISDPTPAPEPTPEPGAPSPEPTPDPTPEPSQTQPQTIKVKFNHEEKELSYDEAVQLAQKGMNYDKAIAKAQQEARDAYIAEQGYEWQGKPITTEGEYKTALREQQILEQYKELPPEVAQKLSAVDQLEQRVNSYERERTLSQQEKTLAEKPFFKEWEGEIKGMANQLNCDYDVAYAMLAEQKMPEILAGYESKLQAAKDDAVKEYIAQKTKPKGTVEGTGATPIIETQQPKSFADARRNSLELLKLQMQKE